MKDLREHIPQKLRSLPIRVKACVLYGSWARGAQTGDSDIDLLVISDEVNPKRHRRGGEIALIKEYLALDIPADILLLTTSECSSNFRNHNPLFLDIACEGIILLDDDGFLEAIVRETNDYILARKLNKLEDGWTFPVADRTPAFLSKVSNKDFAFVMLTDGERDLAIAVKIMEDGYYDKAVYHFQQAVEKAVKAVLICFGVFKKTHFIGEILIKDIESRELDGDWKEKLAGLGRISAETEPEVTWSRYPGIDEDNLWVPYEEYTESDADEVGAKSKEAVAVAREFVKWWFKESIPEYPPT